MNRDEFIAYVQRDDIPREELSQWFVTVRDFLQAAYITAETPWQQSGKSSTYEEWVRLRIGMSELITQSGSVLDIGCANGYLLECLLQWTAHKGIAITPYGLDIGAQLVAQARERLPDYAANMFVGNGWDWQPPASSGIQRFDYVRTELVYVPANYQREYVERLLERLVADDGRLIVAHYRSSREDLSSGWADEQLAAWGFAIDGIARNYSSAGHEQTRYIAIRR